MNAEYTFVKPTTECLIDAKKVKYDACSSGELKQAIVFYRNKFKYIGSSDTYFLDGVENTDKKVHHFFVKK